MGVLHRDEVGDIDIVWGDENGGWHHIVTKHVGEGKSFRTEEEAIEAIENIVNNGEKDFENGDKIVFKQGDRQVVIRKNYRENGKKVADKNWVLTAYDEKAADGGVSAISTTNKGEAARATASSAGKGNNSSAPTKGKGKKIELQAQRTDAPKPATKEQIAIRDGMAEHLNRAGLQTFADEELGQRIVDFAEHEGQIIRGNRTKRALETVSGSRDENHQQTAISSAAGAKVLKDLDKLAEDLDESPKTNEKTFIGTLAEALGIKRPEKEEKKRKKDDRHKEGRSRYATFETKNGRIVTIRLSNHNASVSTFDHHGEADSLSIVVSAKRNKTRTLGPTWCWATCCMVLTRGR